MKCKPGDLAVVVNAQCACNIGFIVQVLAPHDGTGGIAFVGQGHVWLVKCHRPMTWYVRGKRYRRKTGPVPDSRLQPIRGLTPGQYMEEELEVAISI
jgi:hypothetical protein